MAKTPTPAADPQSQNFMREVDEAYRSDLMHGFWTKYGRILLVLIGLFLIAFAGFLWWQEQSVAASAEQAESFDSAIGGLDLGDADARETIETLADGDVPGYSDLSRLIAAGLLADDGSVEEAIAKYREVAADTAVVSPLRDLATIRAARLAFENEAPREIIADLAPLAQPDSPWYGVAGEMVAAAYLKDGDEDAAAELYAGMAASNDLPPSLRQRAAQLAAAHGGQNPAMQAVEAQQDGAPTAASGEGGAAAADAGAASAPKAGGE